MVWGNLEFAHFGKSFKQHGGVIQSFKSIPGPVIANGSYMALPGPEGDVENRGRLGKSCEECSLYFVTD